jgi:hypothetical protein
MILDTGKKFSFLTVISMVGKFEFVEEGIFPFQNLHSESRVRATWE